MNRTQRLGVFSAVAAVVVIVVALWLSIGGLPEFRAPGSSLVVTSPTLVPIETMTSAEVTRVAEVAVENVTNVRLGDQAVVAVSAGGAVLVAAPARSPVASPTAVRSDDDDASPVPRVRPVTTPAPRVLTDPLRGVSVVVPPGSSPAAAEGPTLVIGSSKDLQVGQQVIVAPGPGQAPIQAKYAGQGETELEALGLIQYVLDLELPVGITAREGAVLDAKGALVGIIVPDRQKGARPGHVFAVPVEQARNLLTQTRAGQREPTLVPGTRVPEGRPKS